MQTSISHIGAVVMSTAACLGLAACGPPAYEGQSRDRPTWAPPIEQPQPDAPGTYPSPNLDHGCADGETLNGFPCKSVPGTGGVIYPDAPELDTDPPQIPNY